jgi:hypothetical protein
MESLPLELLGHITQHLTANEVYTLALTNQPMLRSIQTLYQRPTSTTEFRMGLWFGTANETQTQLQFSNGPIQSIRRREDESGTKITVAINGNSSFHWEQTPLIASIRPWLRYYLRLRTPFRIIFTTPHLLRPFQRYTVTSRRRKRDHCNIVGITIGFHEYLPLLPKDIYHFSQRIGFNWNMRTQPFSQEGPLVLNLVSEIHISPYLNAMIDRSKSINHSIDLVFTTTQCYASMYCPNPPFASSEIFHSYLELYANTVYSLLVTVNYDTQLKNAEAQRVRIADMYRRAVADVRLDVPATLDDVWSLLQRMELRFRYF